MFDWFAGVLYGSHGCWYLKTANHPGISAVHCDVLEGNLPSLPWIFSSIVLFSSWIVYLQIWDSASYTLVRRAGNSVTLHGRKWHILHWSHCASWYGAWLSFVLRAMLDGIPPMNYGSVTCIARTLGTVQCAKFTAFRCEVRAASNRTEFYWKGAWEKREFLHSYAQHMLWSASYVSWTDMQTGDSGDADMAHSSDHTLKHGLPSKINAHMDCSTER